MITELAQIKFFDQRVLQPGGAAIIFVKSGPNQILTTPELKNLSLPLSSMVEIFLGCIILKI